MQNLFIKKTFLAFIALMMVVSIFAYPGANKVYAEGEQVVNYQEITETKIFDANASWKYFDKGKDLGTDWIQSSFDDKEWKEGSAPLGYGNGFEKTVVGYGSSSSKKYITTYFRKTFNIENAAQVAALKMTLLRDDGAVVYLNGKEVARSNMPDGAVSFSTKGLTCTEETADYSIDPSLLVNGANTLAVEIHQCSGSSSDIAFGMALTAGIAPAAQPTAEPTQAPTQAPEDDEDSEDPTQAPTQAPTGEPTAEPTAEPTQAPTQVSPVLIDFSNSSWKYFDKGQDLGTDWANGSFDDSSWSEGSAPLGYGNGFEKTVVGYGSSSSKKYITTYFRKTFEVASTAGIEALTLKLLRDDGAVVYLNGKEVVRSNMPDGAVSYSTKALTCTEETADYSIDPSLLVNGKNTVAVEIHQCSGTSSDIAFALGLTTGSTPDPQPTAEPTQAPTQSPTQSPTQVPVPTSTPPLSGSNVFFVAPDGKSGNKGTESSPWDLKTAFSQPSAVKPGATIYLRGGKY
ncbi:MAG: hypothetical protein GX491_14620, partial [Chloroflexi bacterium]|nr:hypothetical protein [Chloroflexota bacterium]